jgi:hypothetical protein
MKIGCQVATCWILDLSSLPFMNRISKSPQFSLNYGVDTHKAVHQSMTFHFGAPYFIKDIDYDLAALEAARGKTAPEVVATQDIANRTSREQSSEYTRDLEVEKTTTLTFEQSFGLTFGAKLSVEVGAGLKGVASANAQTELSWEVSSSAKSGREYKNSRREKVSGVFP